MATVSTKGVLIGGLAAGVVMNALDYVSNNVILGARWTAELNAINPSLGSKMAEPMAIAGFVIVDFLTAFALVWTYGAIRSRFGPGPATAIKAGVLLWFVGMLTASIFMLLSLVSQQMFVAVAAASLVSTLAAALVGGKIYSE